MFNTTNFYRPFPFSLLSLILYLLLLSFSISTLAAEASISKAAQLTEKQNSSSQSKVDQTEAAQNLVAANILKDYLNPHKLHLRSSTALIYDVSEHVTLYDKESDKTMPIASLTKVMTAMVIIDKKLDLKERIRIKRKDRDRLRGSKSRLSYGTILTRADLLKISLAASENRAAKALARTYPGGREAFIAAMNKKAQSLGMLNTTFRDSTGLHSGNISTANDLVKLVIAARKYPLIQELTTIGKSYVTDLRAGWKVEFFNTNRLVRRAESRWG